MPPQTETQAECIARLIVENEKFRDKLARLQEAVGRIISEFDNHDNVPETEVRRLRSALAQPHEK